MARSGLYKSDVQRARDRLRATGTHPSVDAVRIALGNTGSKTTIHRYLRELEEDEGQGVGAKMAVSDALQDLIARLAERLHSEADTVVAQAQSRFQAQLQERTQALEQARQETGLLSTQLQRTEVALQTEREAGDAARSEVARRTTELAQLEERIAGLTVRVAEHDAHAKSLEQKHDHAREALEHYRTSVKDSVSRSSVGTRTKCRSCRSPCGRPTRP
ncbi:Plasmid replication region DNA-binding N-term (plasmid) [Xanthomonas citri pv. citri]